MLAHSLIGVLAHPNFDPVAVQVGPLRIHWYGLMYLLAFLVAWMLARHRSGRPYSPIKKNHIDDLIFYGALGVVLGGRFGYVLFYNFGKFLQDPLWLVAIWDGGMSFHGGLLGVIVAMFLFARKLGKSPGTVLDFVAPMVPIGLGLGRIGNFIGQELWGRPTDLAWAMQFPADPEGLARHPSQLYQAGLEGIALFGLVFYFSRRERPPWAVSGVFLLGYATQRFFVEFARQPDSHIQHLLFGWMTRGQQLCLPMFLAGILMLVYAYR
ncbi:MAG: prolipoprotein diacylglyceryl transferase, partial [Pseudomonadales bacterium]